MNGYSDVDITIRRNDPLVTLAHYLNLVSSVRTKDESLGHNNFIRNARHSRPIHCPKKDFIFIVF
jgi:hypothetical protein